MTNNLGITTFEDREKLIPYNYEVNYTDFLPETGSFILNNDTTIQINFHSTTVNNFFIPTPIYPNPFQNELNINLFSPARIVELISMDGTIVKQFSGLSAGKNNLAMHDIPAGIYLLFIRYDQNIVRSVLVKQPAIHESNY